MVQRKNKPSFFARASLLIKRLWQFVSVDIWHVTEYKLHIHILKTLNLSVRCFLNEKLQEKASALTFSTILAIVPALAMLFAYYTKSVVRLFPGATQCIGIYVRVRRPVSRSDERWSIRGDRPLFPFVDFDKFVIQYRESIQ